MADEPQMLRPAVAPDPPCAEYPVRLTFRPPDSILISPGPHGFNVMVLPDRVVRIRGRSADHSFDPGRAFFKAVAQNRVFTCHATITRDDDLKTYGRHLTAVWGAVVISAGLTEPRVYDAA
jgi:hypothetical protein